MRATTKFSAAGTRGVVATSRVTCRRNCPHPEQVSARMCSDQPTRHDATVGRINVHLELRVVYESTDSARGVGMCGMCPCSSRQLPNYAGADAVPNNCICCGHTCANKKGTAPAVPQLRDRRACVSTGHCPAAGAFRSAQAWRSLAAAQQSNVASATVSSATLEHG